MMTIRGIIIFFFLVGTATTAPSFDDRIVGGTAAVNGEYPYVVSIKRATGKHSCGGSILDKNHILTAAHCVDDAYVASSISIQYGTVDITGSENLITAEKITYHEDFSVGGAYPNDVAVIKLSDNIIFGPTAQPVKLPETSDTPEGNVVAVLIGWGRNETNGQSLKHLQKVDYIKFSDEYCQSTESEYNSLYHVCAGVIGGGKGQCNGDSGGPMTINGVQYGIVSWSVKPCANADHPGILTRVSSYLDWIKANMQE